MKCDPSISNCFCSRTVNAWRFLIDRQSYRRFSIPSAVTRGRAFPAAKRPADLRATPAFVHLQLLAMVGEL
ncbi:hypothetical protein ACH95_08455 [Bacillus glycinifermentans]|nr:hypothetical protein ACH95_08455 [Bacillus glycinifermentans]